MLGPLGAMAGAAQSSGGAFTLEDISALHAEPGDIAGAKAAIDKLAADKVLIEARDDEFGRTYLFLDESVPSYLWLLAAQGRFFDSAGRRSRGGTA